MNADFEKIVIVTRQTRLEELVARFNTQAQARFYLEHAGQDFTVIQAEHNAYSQSLSEVKAAIPTGFKQQVIDRALVTNFRFEASDLIITLGPDGLVVNVAKYAAGQPILAVNPDPQNIDGVLMPFDKNNMAEALRETLAARTRLNTVSMAQAELEDGQTIIGFNDLFIGANSHVSARYRLRHQGKEEQQSSSGIIVSTGAGSTGWLQSVYAGASAVVTALGGQVIPPPDGGRLPWDAKTMIYSVREPFPSLITGTALTYGQISRGRPLEVVSQMAANGVIFSDGIEQDYLEFNSGATARITLASQQARLVA